MYACFSLVSIVFSSYFCTAFSFYYNRILFKNNPTTPFLQHKAAAFPCRGRAAALFGYGENGGGLKVYPRKAAVYTATTSPRVGVIWLVDMQVSCSASSASAAKSAGSTLFSCARFAGMPTPALS